MARKKSADGNHVLDTGLVLRLYRAFAHHLRPIRGRLALAAVCMLGVTATEILKPWPLKVIFDVILMPQQQTRDLVQSSLPFASDAATLLALMVSATLLIAVVGGLFGFGQFYLLSLAGQKVVTSIRIELYSHIQRLSQNFHDERSTGDLMTRLTSDVQMMRELLVNSGLTMAARALTVAGSLAVMFFMDWQLSLIAVAIVPVLAVVTWQFGRRIKAASRQLRRREGKLAQVMSESISAIRVVQAYARESFEESRFANQTEEGAEANLRSSRLEAHMERLVQIVLAVGTCGVIWFGVKRVQGGFLTPGDLLVFTAYLASLYKPVRKLSSTTGRMTKAAVSGERILDILRLQPEVGDAPDAVEAPRLKGAITFRGVSFAYKRGTPVLEQANFHVAAGETVALMSKSGTGKSTIANLLLRFYDPVKGSVRLDGTDIRQYKLESVRRQIAVVLQEAVLFNASIRENIAYGRLGAADAEIVDAARLAGAHDFVMKFPQGYDTMVGERGALLSGGQRQRIAIARAFIRDASILILDEPLTGLDIENEKLVRDALQRLMHGRTSIIITHDADVAKDASRVFTISNGRVREIDGWSEQPLEMVS